MNVSSEMINQHKFFDRMIKQELIFVEGVNGQAIAGFNRMYNQKRTRQQRRMTTCEHTNVYVL